MIRLKSERWRGCQGMPLLAALRKLFCGAPRRSEFVRRIGGMECGSGSADAFGVRNAAARQSPSGRVHAFAEVVRHVA